MHIDFKALTAPFPAEDIEWREQRNGVKNGKPWTIVLAYVTNRAIQNRLDDVVGPASWKNEFTPGPGGGVLCGISIHIDGEWVTKWDGADNTDIESVKGGLSDAMKRAAVQWGIGRYLYRLEANFAVIDERGNHRGIAYGSDADRKARKNPVYFRWNPPPLPPWALPEGGKEAKSQREAPREEKKDAARPDVPDFPPHDSGAPAPSASYPSQAIPPEAPVPEESGETFDQEYSGPVGIKSINKKSGGTQEKPWVRYTITDSQGERYATFDKSLADDAAAHKDAERTVIIYYKTGKYGRDIESIVPSAEGPPDTDENAITEADWNELKGLMEQGGMSPEAFIKAWQVMSPRQLRSHMMDEYRAWIQKKTAGK